VDHIHWVQKYEQREQTYVSSRNVDWTADFEFARRNAGRRNVVNLANLGKPWETFVMAERVEIVKVCVETSCPSSPWVEITNKTTFKLHCTESSLRRHQSFCEIRHILAATQWWIIADVATISRTSVRAWSTWSSCWISSFGWAIRSAFLSMLYTSKWNLRFILRQDKGYFPFKR